jgi:hypothetical protein
MKETLGAAATGVRPTLQRPGYRCRIWRSWVGAESNIRKKRGTSVITDEAPSGKSFVRRLASRRDHLLDENGIEGNLWNAGGHRTEGGVGAADKAARALHTGSWSLGTPDRAH